MKNILQNTFEFDILLSENEVATYINKKNFPSIHENNQHLLRSDTNVEF